jgi:hypothetical protein
MYNKSVGEWNLHQCAECGHDDGSVNRGSEDQRKWFCSEICFMLASIKNRKEKERNRE